VPNPEEAAIVYDGPSAPAWEAAEMNNSNEQRAMSLSTLRCAAGVKTPRPGKFLID
jgi:hypothetical protein